MAKSLGSERLREWRKGQGMTQEGAAELLGCTSTEVSRYERGTVRPGLRVASTVHMHAGIPMHEWLVDVPS